jgi:hypothetical protein
VGAARLAAGVFHCDGAACPGLGAVGHDIAVAGNRHAGTDHRGPLRRRSGIQTTRRRLAATLSRR